MAPPKRRALVRWLTSFVTPKLCTEARNALRSSLRDAPRDGLLPSCQGHGPSVFGADPCELGHGGAVNQMRRRRVGIQNCNAKQERQFTIAAHRREGRSAI